MKKSFFTCCISAIATVLSLTSLHAQNPTYKIGETTYILGETYSTTGLPKVQRSATAKKEFLNSMGYEKTPAGYEVDHITPLSNGGADSPYNMQLLTKEQHKQKTAAERSTHSLLYTPNSSSTFTYPGSTYSAPKVDTRSSRSSGSLNGSLKSSSSASGRTLYTGSRGGTYYYNSNGNKTYVKSK